MMLGSIFKSQAIMAAAGSGKTEDMALRLLGMIIKDQSEEELFFRSSNTMTFTKAATAEIYSRLVELVFNAIQNDNFDSICHCGENVNPENPVVCGELNCRLATLKFDLPRLTRNDLIEVLKKLIRNMSTLKITTIDSFMSSIINSYPFELGLPGSVNLLDDGAQKKIKERIILRLFNESKSSNNNLNGFIDSYKLMELGKKDGIKCLDNTIKLMDDAVEFFGKGVFAEEDSFYRIEFNSNELLEIQDNLKSTELVECDKILSVIEKYSVQNGLKECLYFILSAKLDTIFPTHFRDIIKAFLIGLNNTESKLRVQGFIRGWDALAEVSVDLKSIFDLALKVLIYQSNQRAMGMLHGYRQYIKLYHEEFYSKGNLTFNDLPKLLANYDNEWTYEIAYRMNNLFNHWLIDEFQDTSRIQWQVINNIIDVNSEEANRSVFLVGDTKQAIYTWRDGDRKLFGEVIDEYKFSWNLQEVFKNESFRYAQNICAGLNLIFNAENICRNKNILEDVKKAWNATFQDHKISSVIANRQAKMGFGNQYIYDEFECYVLQNKLRDDAIGEFTKVIRQKLYLRKIIENNHSCAILVRKSTTGIAIKNQLILDPNFKDRVIWEGDENIGKNKFSIAVTSLLIYLQHPGDLLNKQIALMDMAVRHLVPKSRGEELSLAQRLSNDGIYETIQYFIKKLLSLSENDDSTVSEIKEFLQLSNIEDLLTAAKDFSNFNSNSDAIEFRNYLDTRKSSDVALNGKIRIMTIHKSKGLTFDFCFFVANSDKNLNKLDYTYATFAQSDDGKIVYPFTEMHSLDESFRANLEAKLVDESFEEICASYVALTRAKYGMYVILPKPSDSKRKLLLKGKKIYDSEEPYYISDMLLDTIGSEDNILDIDSAEISDAKLIYRAPDDISRDLKIKEKVAEINLAPLEFSFSNGNMRRQRISPSKIDDESSENKLYFELPNANSANNFGNSLHELFSQIVDINQFELPASCSELLKNHFLNCLNSSEINQLLSAQSEKDCWREKSFDCIINNSWVSGCFDRVNLMRDENGEIVKAQIIDYKSSFINEENHELKLKNYKRQLNNYRNVLAKMLSLSANDIECYLIFTRYGKLERV